MPGWLTSGAAAFLAVAGQHVEHAGRQELLADLGHQQHAQRRVLGRLHHHGVAGAQRGRDLERGQHHRRVPRDDGADDAQRLAAGVGQHVLAERQGLALELARQPAEIAEDVGRHAGLAARLGAQRIAGLERDGARQLLAAGLEGLGDPEQRLAALARHDLAPVGIGLGRRRRRRARHRRHCRAAPRRSARAWRDSRR